MFRGLTPALRNPVHLGLGLSAVGCLRAACACGGMPGTVVGIEDDLGHGPLDDGLALEAYLRALSADWGDSTVDSGALASPWQVVIGHLEQEHPDAVVVWTGSNVADSTFLAMACERLSERPLPIYHVCVPEVDGRPFVAMHSPEQLARFYETRCSLAPANRIALTQEFFRIRDTCGPVRRLLQGQVVGAPIDCHDHLLLAACSREWRSAADVVGQAMTDCDGTDLLGDMFFKARLGHLIHVGLVEAKAPGAALRDGSVRLTVSL